MTTLLFPPGARMSCQLCGECCKRWDITFSERELAALRAHDWVSLFPDLAGRKLFEPERRSWRQPRAFRFALQENNACAFLDPTSNKCRMHSRLGGGIKPLVCRQFPFTFTDTSVGTFVGLRFNCPAVLHNKGKKLAEQKDDLLDLLAACRQSGPLPKRGAPLASSEIPFVRRQTLWWSEIMEIERYVMRAIAEPPDEPAAMPENKNEPGAEAPPGMPSADEPARNSSAGDIGSFVNRLLLGARVIDFVAGSNLAKVRGERLNELLALTRGLSSESYRQDVDTPLAPLDRGELAANAPLSSLDRGECLSPPSAVGRAVSTVFRQFVGFFFNREYLGEHRKSFFGRFKALGFSVLKNNLRFSFGKGALQFRELPAPVDSRAVEAFQGGRFEPQSVELLERYFLTKLIGRNAMGDLFFGQGYVDGYYLLMLLVTAVLWYSRCSALSHGRTHIAHEDVCWAVRYVDFSFGSTHALGSSRERMKIFALTLPERAKALLKKYS